MKTFIFEGISGAGKSLLLKKIQKQHALYRANMWQGYFSEHLTQRFLEQKKLDHDEVKKVVRNHLFKIIDFIKHMHDVYKDSNFKKRGVVVGAHFIERFFITHIIDGNLSLADATYFCKKYRLPCKLHHVILKVPNDQIAARIESTLEGRNPFWHSYIHKIKAKRGARWLDYFVEKQQAIMDNVHKLPMPTIVLDTSKQDYERYATYLFDLAYRKEDMTGTYTVYG